MSLRTAIFWIHLPVGVTAAIVILMMAVTGVVLTYEAQLNQWALRGYRADPPAPDVAPLGLDELIARVTVDQSAGLVTSVALESDPREPAVVELDDGDPVHVDRFTGERLGDGNTRTRRFLRSVMYWHRWFALEGEYRIIGRTFTATANLGFLFLVVSGFYLWWPRTWTRHSLRNVTWFRRGLDGKARDFNWHNAIGFWTALPLLIIVFSGAMISYQWVGNLIYAAVGEPPPLAQRATGGRSRPPGRCGRLVTAAGCMGELPVNPRPRRGGIPRLAPAHGAHPRWGRRSGDGAGGSRLGTAAGEVDRPDVRSVQRNPDRARQWAAGQPR